MKNYFHVMIFIMLAASLAGCGEPAEQAESSTQKTAAEAEPELAFPVLERPAYDQIRIYDFPMAVQCWTFRKFTFMETLDKIKEMDVSYVEAYPGQTLSPENSNIAFDHNLEKSYREMVKRKLKENNLQLINYGVVGFENDEAAMKKVFDFAQNMGIRTIVTEPAFDDYSLLEKMVKKTGIHVAIHNHPEPSKYARPETVLEHIDGLDSRIGVCADTGHWMRTGVNPVEALRMLEGRTNMKIRRLRKIPSSLSGKEWNILTVLHIMQVTSGFYKKAGAVTISMDGIIMGPVIFCWIRKRVF